MQNKSADPLLGLRNEILERVRKSGNTVEQFCWEHGLNKATISNFLRQKKDFRVSTLEQIAKALDSTLVISLKSKR